MKPFRFKAGKAAWRVDVPAKFSADGKRKAKYFESQEDAFKFCKEVKKPGFTLDGYNPVVSKAERDEFSIAVKRFAALYDGNPAKAFAAHERLVKLSNIKPATVREAIEAFIEARKTGWSPKGVPPSVSTIDTDRWRLLKLDERFSAVQLSDLTETELRTFFDQIKGKNKKSIRKSVAVFFGWAIQYKYVGENPMAGIKPMGKYGVNNDHYSVATFKQMLLIAAGLEPVGPGKAPTRDFIDMLPYFVLGGFGGVRPCEVVRVNHSRDAIRWSDLHFDVEDPNIEIREAITKRTARDSDLRHIDAEYALEAIRAWLPLCKNESPQICRWTKRYMQELKRRFTKATGIKFIKNGFRNSFATFALSYSGLSSLGAVARQMGNSEGIVRRHYARSLPAGSGRAWFNLRPFEIVSSQPASVMAKAF